MSLMCLKCHKPESKAQHNIFCTAVAEELLKQCDEFFAIADEIRKFDQEQYRRRIIKSIGNNFNKSYDK